MIFLTVGHQMPFDRLVRAVDAWAAQHGGCGGRREVFAQIGAGEYQPRHMKFSAYLSPEMFAQRMQESDQIVAHAGTGTIIAAVRYGKPLLVLPRLAKLNETRSDHQVATAQRFEQAGYLLAAYHENELPAKLEALAHFRPTPLIADSASPQLIARLRRFSFGEDAA